MEEVKATSETVACTLTEKQRRERQEELRRGLLAIVRSVRETDAGFDLAFSSSANRGIAAIRRLRKHVL